MGRPERSDIGAAGVGEVEVRAGAMHGAPLDIKLVGVVALLHMVVPKERVVPAICRCERFVAKTEVPLKEDTTGG
jgi:hypothetical protein